VPRTHLSFFCHDSGIIDADSGAASAASVPSVSAAANAPVATETPTALAGDRTTRCLSRSGKIRALLLACSIIFSVVSALKWRF